MIVLLTGHAAEQRAIAELERDRYLAVVEELHDMPEIWPEWVRARHRAEARGLAMFAQAQLIEGSMLWQTGREIFGALLITDSLATRERAARMLMEAARR